MESFSDQARAFLLTVGFHALLIVFAWWSASWAFSSPDQPAAGEPIRATLQVSSADLRRVEAAIKAAPKPPTPQPEAPPPQPIPERAPQTSDIPQQMAPQAPQERPDTVDQERISKLALEQAEKRVLEEQEARRRQEQVELTEDIERQRLAERRQRLRELQEVQAELLKAKRERLEAQRLQQLADQKAAAAATPAAPAGNRGVDESLLARYKAAMKQTADSNWNHFGAPPLVHCKVRFTQIVGGEVINVEFMSCPYDAQGREFVERALLKNPMPYAGFEAVFRYARTVELDFCHPREECE